MLSTTTLQTTYGQLTNDTSASNKSLGLQLINEAIRNISADHPWDFLEKTADISTVDGTQFYDLPYDYQKLTTIEVTVGTTQYVPMEAPNRRFWDKLNMTTGVESDVPQYYFIFDGQLGLYPTPSTSSNTITVTYRRNLADLVNEDYTTGTISAIANGSATVTGNGTTFTSAMAGRYLRITSPTGDGYWYKIASVTNATTLVLDKNYQGTTIAAGSATYTIAEVPIIPEAFHMMLVYYACFIYFSTKNVDNDRYKKFKELYDEQMKQLKKVHGRKSNSVVLTGDDVDIINPNLIPMDLS